MKDEEGLPQVEDADAGPCSRHAYGGDFPPAAPQAQGGEFT
jgi:hypothetical protein